MITTKAFWMGTLERGLKTWIQAFLAVFAVQAGATLTLSEAASLPWLTAVVTASVAAFLSLVTSIGNAEFVAGEVPEARRAIVVEPARTTVTVEPVEVEAVDVGETPDDREYEPLT